MAEVGLPQGQDLKIFVSYSRLDVSFADQLVAALQAFGFEPIIDRHDISGGEDWKSRLAALLLEAGSVVVVLSPDAVSSPVCIWEMEEAIRLAKRVIPIVARSIDHGSVPERLQDLNQIMFYSDVKSPGAGFGVGLAQLVSVLKIDIDWIREHTRIGALAAYWDRKGRSEAFLLRGPELADAEHWLVQQPAGAPDAGERIRAFLLESRQAEDAAQNKKLREANRVARITTVGFVASSAMALVAAYAAWLATAERDLALKATAQAIVEHDDASEVARTARKKFSDANESLKSNWDDLLDWAPASWRGYLHERKSETRADQGDFTGARSELDIALKNSLPTAYILTSSADLYLILGDADQAYRAAIRALDLDRSDAVIFGNVILSEAMNSDYRAAVAHIDEALARSQRTISSIDNLVSSDVQLLTGGFDLEERDSNYLLALRYFKVILYAMSGDSHFDQALAQVDRFDRDYPRSRTAYLAALNWCWMTARGQALRQARANGGAKNSDKYIGDSVPGDDYGAYVAAGALWERIALTRPQFSRMAKEYFDKFEAAYRAAPRSQYARLADWVHTHQALQAPTPSSDPDAALNSALELEVKANELSRGPNSDNDPFRFAPAIAAISQGIQVLEVRRQEALNAGRAFGRREEDLLIDLLLKRGDWRLSPYDDTQKDYGGAAQDARRVIAIDKNVASAYRLLAGASSDRDVKQAAFEQALKLDPANFASLSKLANLLEEKANREQMQLGRYQHYLHRWVDYKKLAETLPAKDARHALSLKEKELSIKRLWSDDYSQIARLRAAAGNPTGALQAVDQSIALAPLWTSNVEQKYQLELQTGVDRTSAVLDKIRATHVRADHFALADNASDALRDFVEIIRLTANLSENNPVMMTEFESAAHDFNIFLAGFVGQEGARRWWHAVATSPLISPQERQLYAKLAEQG